MNVAWLPHRLLPRMIVVVAIALVAAIAAQGVFTLLQQREILLNVIQKRASGMARSLAIASADALVLGRLDSLDDLLVRSAELPEIKALQVISSQGHVLTRVEQHPRQGPKLIYLQSKVVVNPPNEAQTSQEEVSGEERTVAWYPIQAGAILGWIRVDFSNATLRALRTNVLITTAIASLVAMMGSALLLFMFLQKPIVALERARQFAVTLERSDGHCLAQPRGTTTEIQDLTDALNYASVNLHKQRERLVESIDRLRADERIILDRNAQLDTIFSLSPDGLVSFDRAGLVKFANPAFLHMTDMSLSEIIGLSQIEFEQRLRTLAETPERWPGLDACFISTKVSHGETPPREQRQLLSLRRPRGAVLELVGVNSDAPSVSRLLYIRDVTHEVEVDRMKSEFLSHAAHELRTPMASIFGFTELLLSQDFDDTTRKDLLQTIHKQTAWLVDIINELLDIARIEARRGKDFNIEAVSLPPLLASVIEALQIDQQRWPLSLQCPDHLPNVRADAAKLRQALTNVLANAVKYSPSGGPINILCATSLANGRTHVNINITDHGIGMTPDQVARVCERFYRADTSGNIPGTGLGMAIVKEILELLGGSVNIQSSPNQGTSIRLSLPTIDIDVASAPATA